MARVRSHYDNLKVARDAPPEVIRAAYKSLSLKFHPDRNPGNAEAARIMAIINRSYQILSDPVMRREHDQWLARKERENQTAGTNNNYKNVEYAESNNQTRTSKSNADVVNDTPPTPYILPDDFTSRFFKSPVFYIIALLALAFVSIIPHSTFLGLFKRNPFEISSTSNSKTTENINVNVPFTLPPAVRNSPVVSEAPPPTKRPQQIQNSISLDELSGKDSSLTLPPPYTPTPKPIPTWTRPLTAPNGAPWPTFADYIPGYKILNRNGISEVTIDNSMNDADVFVKLFFLDGAKPYPVRHFFIPAYESFTLNNLSAGNYDVRYRDLTTGRLARSESFELTETETYYGVRYTKISITLYKVLNGNMQTFPLSENDF